jgi:hypothetical protein
VLTFSNKTCSKELTDFYFYSLFSIFCKSPELLLDRSCGLANFEYVLSQLPGDSRHVGWTPCEDVSVVPEEACEREFLFGVEVGPDDDFLGCVRQVEANLLDSWTQFQRCGCALLLWYLQSCLVDLSCLSDHHRCCGFDH